MKYNDDPLFEDKLRLWGWFTACIMVAACLVWLAVHGTKRPTMTPCQMYLSDFEGYSAEDCPPGHRLIPEMDRKSYHNHNKSPENGNVDAR